MCTCTVHYSTVTKRVICKLYLKEHLPKKHKKLEKCFAFLLGPKRGKIVFDQIKGKQHFEVSLNFPLSMLEKIYKKPLISGLQLNFSEIAPL